MRPARSVTQFLRSLLRRRDERELRPDDIHALLVVELTRLGDVLSTLPAVQALATRFPAAHIHLFVDDRFASLLGGLDLDIRVHGIRASASAFGIMSAVRRARRLGVDLACSMSPAKRNVVVALGTGATRKAGYLKAARSLVHYGAVRGVETRGFARAASPIPPGDNIELRALRVCAVLGVTGYPPRAPLRVREDSYRAIRTRLLGQGTIPSHPYLVIHPFSGWTFRSWRLPNFIRLSAMLRSRCGMDSVFLFSRDEESLWSATADGVREGERPRAFISDSLLESAVAIRGARLFVGNDSGPLHLAACLGVPRVGLFGPSSPALTAPLSGPGTHMYHRVECSPCRQHRCVREALTCMDLLSVEDVCGTVCRALGLAPTLEAAGHA